MSSPGNSSSPILDLSYRSYEGPLEPPSHRWWVIAKLSIMQAFKKKAYWGWGLFSGVWYALLMAVFWFVDQFSESMNMGGAPQGMNPIEAFYKNIQWDTMFVNAFSIGQIFLFIVATMIGAGAIANDNRANALLVYLSKPCDKKDYLIGKWVGIFLPLVLVTAIPTFVFYFYCLLSYQQYGFIKQDPWMFWKLIPMVLLPAGFHASALLGISSMSQQARLVSAGYSAIYFILLFFTKTIEGLYKSGDAPAIVKTLYYCSVDGIQIALSKVLLGTDGGPLFPNQPTGMGGSVPGTPNGWAFGGAYFLISAIFIFIAWRKVRAVEVVG